MSLSDLGVFVLATRGVVADEAGGNSTVKGNTMAAIEQAVCTGERNVRAVCTGERNVRALTRVSLHPIP